MREPVLNIYSYSFSHLITTGKIAGCIDSINLQSSSALACAHRMACVCIPNWASDEYHRQMTTILCDNIALPHSLLVVDKHHINLICQMKVVFFEWERKGLPT